MKKHHLIRFLFLSCISILLGVYYTKVFLVSRATSTSIGFSLVIVASTGSNQTGNQETGNNQGGTSSSSPKINIKSEIESKTGSIFTGGHAAAESGAGNEDIYDSGKVDYLIEDIHETKQSIYDMDYLLNLSGLACTMTKEDLIRFKDSSKFINEDLISGYNVVLGNYICVNFVEYIRYTMFNVVDSIMYNRFFIYTKNSAYIRNSFDSDMKMFSMEKKR